MYKPPLSETAPPASHNTWARQHLDGYRVAHAIVDVLAHAGVTEIFGQSCPTALFLAAQQKGLNQIGYRTENAGAAMADGAARINRRVSVITAQNGPAAALLVAGLSEAMKASVPILAIVQEVPSTTADKNAFQELDHEKIFSGCTKWMRRIRVAERGAEYVVKAIRQATSGRPGPVVLTVSPDVLTQEVQPFLASMVPDHGFGMFPADRFIPTPGITREVAHKLLSAERPLIVAGGGVHHSDASDALARLQRKAGVPVATTNMGKGSVDESHPLSIGVIGNAMGTRSVGKYVLPYIQSADFVLFVGSRTNENGTAGWSLFPPTAEYAQIDIDHEEIGRNYPCLRLPGDARATLEALCDHIEEDPDSHRESRTKQLEAVLAEARVQHAKELAPYADVDRVPMRPEQLMALLDAGFDEATWVADASYSSIWLVQYLQSRSAGSRFITPRGIAGLGWGFPMAIGARLANPSTPVVCLTGDGGFAHCWAELETAKRHGVRLTIVVLNNGVLGFQLNAEESRFGTHTSVCHFGPIDHVAIARACGCDGARVENADDLRRALASAADSDVPFVIDAVVDPQAFPPLTAFEDQLIPLDV